MTEEADVLVVPVPVPVPVLGEEDSSSEFQPMVRLFRRGINICKRVPANADTDTDNVTSGEPQERNVFDGKASLVVLPDNCEETMRRVLFQQRKIINVHIA